MEYSGKSGRRPLVAFGPVMPGWGSWDWLGADVANELTKYYRTIQFEGAPLPNCDVLVIVKHAPVLELAVRAAYPGSLLYCPVDYYGSPADIEADGPLLRKCTRILVHCEQLRRYFEPFAPVEYLDHHVKFVTPMREKYQAEGYLLWVGVRTNLPALVEWVNAHPLPGPLLALTNLEKPEVVPGPEDFGFRPDLPVRIENWSKERHLELVARARAALDIKDCDFRSRHKPPAKAIDFIASGVPLAMNAESSGVEHLARMGFEVASPGDPYWWLSREYWEETQRFGRALSELLSLKRIGLRYKRIIDEVLQR